MVARSLCNEDFLTLKLPTSGGVAVACETFQVIHSMQRVAYRYISWCTYQLQPFKSGNPSPCRQIYRTSVKGSVDKCPFNGTGLGISQGQHYMAPKFFHVHVSALHSGTGTSTASGRAYHQQPRPAKWWWYKYLFLASNGQTFPLRNLWLHVGFFSLDVRRWFTVQVQGAQGQFCFCAKYSESGKSGWQESDVFTCRPPKMPVGRLQCLSPSPLRHEPANSRLTWMGG